MQSLNTAIMNDATPVTVRGETLHKIWWQGRQWAVTAFGLECRDGSYPIEAKRLREDHRKAQPWSWIAHMGTTKTWVDVDDFVTAFFVACAMHGHQLPERKMAMLRGHHTKAKKMERRGDR